MDRNTITGILLIGVLLLAYTWYNAPSEEELAKREAAQQQAALEAEKAEAASFAENAQGTNQDSLALISEADSATVALMQAQQQALLNSKFGALAGAAEGEEELTTVRNSHFEISFSNKGGVPVSVKLLEHKTYGGESLYLFRPETQRFGYQFTYPSLGKMHTSDFYFDLEASPKLEVLGEDQTSIVYVLSTPDGRRMEQRYTIFGDRFDIRMQTVTRDMGGIVTDASLTWELAAEHIEKGLDAERNNSTIFYKESGQGRDYLSETSDDEEVLSRDLEWLAYKQNFFSVILMRDDEATNAPAFGKNARIVSYPFDEQTDSLTQYYFAELPMGELNSFSARLYMGPNNYKVLRSYGMETDRIINLGWGIFGWVNRFLVIPIFDWLQATGMSYGIIILILTLIIKMLLGPLTWKNYLSSAKMRVLKPEIDELNEKYKDAEPMKKQQATMELYRKTGVNPFAGCLPMLVQLPILYAMFRFFPNAIQLRQEEFLWADDLSSYDSIATLPFTIPAYGDHVSLFTLLMAASTLAYTVFNSSNMPTQTQPGMPNMKVIMYIFPFMMLFFFNSFASSLSYYYFLANLTSLLQMWFIKRFLIDEDKIREKIAENKKKRGKAGKSRFQKKLEEMAKQRGLNVKN